MLKCCSEWRVGELVWPVRNKWHTCTSFHFWLGQILFIQWNLSLSSKKIECGSRSGIISHPFLVTNWVTLASFYEFFENKNWHFFALCQPANFSYRLRFAIAVPDSVRFRSSHSSNFFTRRVPASVQLCCLTLSNFSSLLFRGSHQANPSLHTHSQLNQWIKFFSLIELLIQLQPSVKFFFSFKTTSLYSPAISFLRVRSLSCRQRLIFASRRFVFVCVILFYCIH